MLGKPEVGHWIGYFEFFLAILLVILLVTSPRLGRPALYYIQIGLVLAWLLVEALLDYILKIDFRQVRGMVIPYVTLFFAASGGLVGVAANAGTGWMWLASILFILTTALAFIQRRVTGI